MQAYFNFFYSKNLGYFQKAIVIRAGRNFTGRICVQHQGGGTSYKHIKIDRYRNVNLYGTVFRIIRNISITGYIGLIVYENGLISFVLLAEGVTKGTIIFSGTFNKFLKELQNGNTQLLSDTKLFEPIHSVETIPGGGAVLIRAAGGYSYITAREKFNASLKLMSGWHIILSSQVLVTIGRVSNISHSSTNLKKAGVSRKLGVRPVVRGVIKNPCDHPHGGGEGRGSPPVAQVSPWGWLCKGTPSNNKKKERIKRKLFKKKEKKR